MRVAQAGDSCGQMTFPVLTPAISGAHGFRGSSGPLLPTPARKQSADQTLDRALLPRNLLALLHLPRAPGSLGRGSMLPRVGRGALAGPGTWVAGKLRSHPERAALCRGTAVCGAPSPERGD